MNRMTAIHKQKNVVFVLVFTEFSIFFEKFLLRLTVRLAGNVLRLFVDKSESSQQNVYTTNRIGNAIGLPNMFDNFAGPVFLTANRCGTRWIVWERIELGSR